MYIYITISKLRCHHGQSWNFELVTNQKKVFKRGSHLKYHKGNLAPKVPAISNSNYKQ